MKKKTSKKTKEVFIPKRIYSLIPSSTMESLMGEDRWNLILKFIKKRYGTKKIHLGYHKKGEGAVIYLTKTRKCLGSVAHVERRAIAAA